MAYKYKQLKCNSYWKKLQTNLLITTSLDLTQDACRVPVENYA